MKIDENAINHNAVRLIDAIASDCYEVIDAENPRISRERALMMLGEIAGITDMVNAMKEVLNA